MNHKSIAGRGKHEVWNHELQLEQDKRLASVMLERKTGEMSREGRDAASCRYRGMCTQ